MKIFAIYTIESGRLSSVLDAPSYSAALDLMSGSIVTAPELAATHFGAEIDQFTADAIRLFPREYRYDCDVEYGPDHVHTRYHAPHAAAGRALRWSAAAAAVIGFLGALPV